MKTTHFKRYRNVVLTKAAASLDAFFCSKLFLIRSHLLHTYIHICMYVQSFQSTYIYETAKNLNQKKVQAFQIHERLKARAKTVFLFLSLSLFLPFFLSYTIHDNYKLLSPSVRYDSQPAERQLLLGVFVLLALNHSYYYYFL